jgi:chromate transporter
MAEGESDVQSSTQPGRANPTLSDLAKVFSRIGALTFGGGATTMAALQWELVNRRGWTNRKQFETSFALSRLTVPIAINLFAFCTAIGWTLRGWAGAAASLLAASVPCSALAVLFTLVYRLFGRNPFAASAIRGTLASAVGILIASSWELVRPYLNRNSWPRVAILLIASIVLSVGLHISPIPILALSAIVGFTWRENSL